MRGDQFITCPAVPPELEPQRQSGSGVSPPESRVQGGLTPLENQGLRLPEESLLGPQGQAG